MSKGENEKWFPEECQRRSAFPWPFLVVRTDQREQDAVIDRWRDGVGSRCLDHVTAPTAAIPFSAQSELHAWTSVGAHAMPKVAIAGGGLVGALNACFFARKGWQVEVYESRKDIRQMEHVQGRSINLALSQRGKCALEAVGLKDYIVEQGVEMHARLVHDVDGKTQHRLPYGQPGQHIVSINRRHLNEVMLSEAEKFPNVTFFFEHRAMKAKPKEGILTVNNLGTLIDIDADLILACDGAHSAVRRSLMAYPLFQYSQEYIAHGYVELNILPKQDQYTLEPNVFHLWPRGDYTLIALANRDKTFTVTIFAPFALFEREMHDDASVVAFFQRQFPDAYALLGPQHIQETFRRVKPLPLVSLKCDPHQFDEKVLLMGDAAHAMVPFYGQGMNAGFEDCLVLSETFLECNDDIQKTLQVYSKRRTVDAHAINDLAMYNYNELKDLVNKTSYKLRKKLDLWLNWYFPEHWIPLYSMVTFNRIPYHEVIETRARQDKLLERVGRIFGVLGAAAVVYGVVRHRERLLDCAAARSIQSFVQTVSGGVQQ